GGGTAILAGSHHLLARWETEMEARCRDAQAHRAWFHRAHPWLAALSGAAPSPSDRRKTFMEDGAEIDGVHVRVVELTGEPGDLVFSPPTIVHCASPNCAAWPRLMRIGSVGTERLAKLRKGEV